MQPQVFISHSSEDKEKFVIKLAERLVSKGVDVWFDAWEIRPGDSLVDKIFEEGIKDAEAFIIVLSLSSVGKPWVREELNAAFIKRISKKCRLIPVIIDECEVPEALKSTAWVIVRDLDNYDNELEQIVSAIFGTSTKPEIGAPPRYTSFAPINDLNAIDSRILIMSCEIADKKGFNMLFEAEIEQMSDSLEIGEDEFFDSLQVLNDAGLIEGKTTFGRNLRIAFFKITTYGYELFAGHHYSDYDSVRRSIIGKIVNEGADETVEIAAQTGYPLMLVNHTVDQFANQRLLMQVKINDGSNNVKLLVPSPTLKRYLMD